MTFTFRSPPRISKATFTSVLVQFNSPCASIASECYDIVVSAGLDPAIALAVFGKESTFGTRGLSVQWKSWGNVRTAFDPSLASGHDDVHNFAMYPSWQNSLKDWVRRLNVRYIDERGLNTPEAVFPVYAPSTENDTAAYIAFVNAHVATWMAEEAGSMAGNGWYPLGPKVRHVPVPGFWEGNSGRKAMVMHIIEGSLESCINTFKNGQVSAHFAFGQDGSIVQFVSIFDSAWANGASYIDGHWVDPEGARVNPPWVGMQPGINPNKTTISFEHEGHSGDKWSDAMSQSNNEVLLWCAQQAGMHIERGTTLIGHCDISPINRAHCPGPATPWSSMEAYCNPLPQPAGTFPVDVALRDYYTRSGGLWQPDRYGLGYALTPLLPDPQHSGAAIQKFERAALRLRADGGIDALLRSEW